MNLAVTVLNITAPVFGLAAVGFLWVRLGFEYRLEFVTRLAMTLAVPCLIFVALMQSAASPQALSMLILATFAAYLAVGLVMWALVALGRLDRQTYLAPLIFGNTGNLGLPLALFAFGQAGLELAVVIFAAMAVLSFTVGIWMVAGRGRFWQVLREPIVGATLLGALFLWQGWETPAAVTRTLELIGQMAIPLMLITLGVAVARLEIRTFTQALLLSAVKVAVCVGIGWSISQGFGLDPIASGILILQLATPVAVTSYMIAAKYGIDAQPVAGLVVISTLLSVVTLPLILSFVI